MYEPGLLVAPAAEAALADVSTSSNEAVQGCIGLWGVLWLFLLSCMECADEGGRMRAWHLNRASTRAATSASECAAERLIRNLPRTSSAEN